MEERLRMGYDHGEGGILRGSHLQLPPFQFLGWGLLGTRDNSFLLSEGPGRTKRDGPCTVEKPLQKDKLKRALTQASPPLLPL